MTFQMKYITNAFEGARENISFPKKTNSMFSTVRHSITTAKQKMPKIKIEFKPIPSPTLDPIPDTTGNEDVLSPRNDRSDSACSNASEESSQKTFPMPRQKSLAKIFVNMKMINSKKEEPTDNAPQSSSKKSIFKKRLSMAGESISKRAPKLRTRLSNAKDGAMDSMQKATPSRTEIRRRLSTVKAAPSSFKRRISAAKDGAINGAISGITQAMASRIGGVGGISTCKEANEATETQPEYIILD